MGAPRISIAMATLNGERFLQEQLESLAAQTLLPHELILCDDGSVDQTISILEAFSSEAAFPVEVIVNEENLGPGDNFLKAASLCTGDWVAFCDQDDVWFSDKLIRIAEVIRSVPRADMISHSAIQVGEHLERLPSVPNYPDYPSLSITGPLRNKPMRSLPGFSCVFRKSIFEAVPYEKRPRHMFRPDQLQPHDNFVYNVTNSYGHILRIPDVLALHRRHERSLTGNPGTGIKREYTAVKSIMSRGAKHREALSARADHARAHQVFYEEVLHVVGPDGPIDEFERRTRAAVEYYRSLATSYAKRAAIYSDDMTFSHKMRALVRCLRAGAYGDHAGGRGIGPGGLLRDLAAVFLSW